MTNKLLSEEELKESISSYVLGTPHESHNYSIFANEVAKRLLPLIQSQKKAFAEYVIGENETGVITNPDSPDYGEPYVNTTADRDEQRKRAGI